MTVHNEEALLFALKNADGWVVRMLNKYGNSVYPSSLVKAKNDIPLGEKVLSIITKRKVAIEKTTGGYICKFIEE